MVIKTAYLENKPHGPDAYMPLDMPDWDQVSLGVNRRELIGLFNNREFKIYNGFYLNKKNN